MRQGASRTAALVTLYRAIESSRPAAMRLFEDPFAPAFLEWRVRLALRLSRLPVIGAALPWSLVDGHWSGPRGTVAVRTRYRGFFLCEGVTHYLSAHTVEALFRYVAQSAPVVSWSSPTITRVCWTDRQRS
jgi:O-methyltransferase involved in polyketide biosynthesis